MMQLLNIRLLIISSLTQHVSRCFTNLDGYFTWSLHALTWVVFGLLPSSGPPAGGAPERPLLSWSCLLLWEDEAGGRGCGEESFLNKWSPTCTACITFLQKRSSRLKLQAWWRRGGRGGAGSRSLGFKRSGCCGSSLGSTDAPTRSDPQLLELSRRHSFSSFRLESCNLHGFISAAVEAEHWKLLWFMNSE